MIATSARVLLVMQLLFGSACADAVSASLLDAGGGEPGIDAGTMRGSGSLLHWDVDVRWLDRTTFAAVLIGSRSLELVDVDTLDSRLIAAPASDCAPIALSVLDLQGDGDKDVAVFEAQCDHWVVSSASRAVQSSAWPTNVPMLPKAHFFGADGLSLYAATSRRFVRMARLDGGWSPSAMLAWDSPGIAVSVSDVAMPLPDGRMLIQRGRSVQVVERDGGASSLIEQGVQPPYLRSFDGFDHLTPHDACGVGIGVSLFEASAGVVPRRLQVLSLGDELRTRELATPFEVMAFAISGQTLGMLGQQDGELHLASARLRDCMIEDLRIAPGPITLRGVLSSGARAAGVKMLARAGALPEFVLYDGFTLHRLRVGDGADFVEHHVLHPQRTDLLL